MDTYRRAEAPLKPSDASAVRAAASWALRYGIAPHEFERAVERVVAARAPESATRGGVADSFPGVDVIDATDRAPSESPSAVGPDCIVYYRIGTGAASVSIRENGSVRSVADADARPLRRRREITWSVGALGILANAVACWWYVAQDPWFWRHGGMPLIFGALFLCAAMLAATVSEWLLGRGVRSNRRVASLLAAALVGSIAAWSVVRLFRPTRAHAIELLERGRVSEAFAEANAVDAVAGVDESAVSAADDLRIRTIRPDVTLNELSALLGRSWRTEAARSVIRERLIRRARARGDILMDIGNDALALRSLAGAVAMTLPTERTLWVEAADLIDAPAACLNPEPDAFCMRRALDRAESAHIPERMMRAVQGRFVTAAELWLNVRLREAHPPCPQEINPDQLDSVVSYAHSIESQLQVQLAFDSAAVQSEAARVRAACCPCRGGTRVDPTSPP